MKTITFGTKLFFASKPTALKRGRGGAKWFTSPREVAVSVSVNLLRKLSTLADSLFKPWRPLTVSHGPWWTVPYFPKRTFSRCAWWADSQSWSTTNYLYWICLFCKILESLRDELFIQVEKKLFGSVKGSEFNQKSTWGLVWHSSGKPVLHGPWWTNIGSLTDCKCDPKFIWGVR